MVIENFEVMQAFEAANKAAHSKGELIEQTHAVFVGLRLGLSDAGLMDYGDSDPVYSALWNAENAIRDRIENRR